MTRTKGQNGFLSLSKCVRVAQRGVYVRMFVLELVFCLLFCLFAGHLTHTFKITILHVTVICHPVLCCDWQASKCANCCLSFSFVFANIFGLDTVLIGSFFLNSSLHEEHFSI